MTCDEFENRFLADQEHPWLADEHDACEKHLAGCTACQALARQLQQLDVALTIKVKAPALSAEFNQRLAKRIQVEATVLPEAQRAERKRQLQAEYEADLAQIRQSPLRLTRLLEGSPAIWLAALVGWLVWQFTPGLVNTLSTLGLSGSNQTLLLAATAGAVFLAIGLAAAFPRPFRQLWSLI